MVEQLVQGPVYSIDPDHMYWVNSNQGLNYRLRGVIMPFLGGGGKEGAERDTLKIALDFH